MAKKHTGKSKKTPADVVEILHRRYFADDPDKQVQIRFVPLRRSAAKA